MKVDPWTDLQRHQKLARSGVGVVCFGALAGLFNAGLGLVGISLGGIMFGIAALIAPSH
jgi:hypothetical protein